MPDFPDVVPRLYDGRVLLRAHQASDLPRIVQFAADPRSRAHVALPAPYGIEQARDFLDQVRATWESGTREGAWAIEVDGRWAGSINLHARAPGTSEIGYGVHPDVRGRGVTTAAARLLVAHAFDDLGLRTLVWRAARGNWASRRVAWTLGFQVDGSWPATHVAADGSVTDTWIGHLHADEPRQPRLPWREPDVLAGAGLRLRAWREDDAPGEEPDDALTRFMFGTSPGRADFDRWLLSRRERMADGEAIAWCIADGPSDRALGGIQLHRMHLSMQEHTAMLAYWLQPSARGAGRLATALELLLPHALADPADGGLGLRSIAACTDTANLPSQRALYAAGFTRTRTTPDIPTYPDGTASEQAEFLLRSGDDRDTARRHAVPAPTVPTDRLMLRPWERGDAPRGEPVADPLAAASMGIDPRPPSAAYDRWLTRERADLLAGDRLSWCIADRRTGRPLGSVWIRGLGGKLRSGTAGYWLYADARGNGYAAEALRAVVEVAFADDGLALQRLDAQTVDGNHSSMLTLAAAGFRQFGVDHGSFLAYDGTPCDTAYFELLNPRHPG